MAMENKKVSKKMNIAIIHPDLGIGGAERLIVDAAVELVSHGHNVHIFSSYHDRNRCFEESLAGENKIYMIIFIKLLTAYSYFIYVSLNIYSKFTASTFAATFKRLNSQGIKPAVLYKPVNVDQFSKPNAYKLNFLSINRFEKKKNIDLAISAFAMLGSPDVM